jgi:hypothetical protein
VAQAVGAAADAFQSDALSRMGSGRNAALADAAADAVAVARQDVSQDAFSDGGLSRQWAGQLAVVAQELTGTAQVGQHHVRGGAGAEATGVAAAEARTSQEIDQAAAGASGLRSQRASQLIGVSQVATASATTLDGTVGPPTGRASSEAIAENASLVVQSAVQHLLGTGGIDIQESAQSALVQQAADAVSSSFGGTAGTATVVNCATVGQGSAQGINAAARASVAGLAWFCAPPASPATPGAATTPGEHASPVGAITGVVPGATVAPPLAVRISRSRSLSTGVVTPALARGATAVPVAGAAQSVPHRVAGAQSAIPQVSAPSVPAPPSGPVRSGAGSVHEEPSLLWPLGLASGAGNASPLASGGGAVAAAMAAFLLALLGGWRLVTGTAVRRPLHLVLRLETPG